MCVTFFINAYKQHRRLLCVLSPRNGNKDLYEDEDMRFNVPQILEFSAHRYLTTIPVELGFFGDFALLNT